MVTSRLRLRSALAFAVTAACLGLSAPAKAQEAPPVTSLDAPAASKLQLLPQDAANFSKAFASLAAQARAVFVSEGAPLVTTLSAEAAAKLTQMLPGETAEQYIGRVAAAYDYDLLRETKAQQARNVYILQKKYSDPRDLPCVTWEEVELALKDAQRLINGFGPRAPIKSEREFIAEIGGTFTKEQRAALAQDGLPVSALSAEQRGQIERMALHLYAAIPARDAENCRLFLEGYRNSSAVRQKTKAGSKVHLQRTFEKLSEFTELNPIKWDADDLKSFYEADPDFKTTAAAPPTTLRQLVTRLQKQTPQTLLSVDAALGDKPLGVWGLDNAPAADVMHAVADLYGLRVRRSSEDSSLRLARVPVVPPQRLSELYPSVWRALPPAFLRAGHLGASRRMDEERHKRLTAPNPVLQKIDAEIKAGTLSLEEGMRRAAELDPLKLRDPEWDRQKHIYDSFTPLMVNEGLRRVIWGIERALGEQDRIPFTSLDAPTRAAWAVNLMGRYFLNSLHIFGQKEPPLYIQKFDEAVVTFKPTTDGNKPLMQLLIEGRESNGDEFRAISGGFAAPYSSSGP